MNEGRSPQWFPGHMAKARRVLRESLPLVDIALEMLDARIPRSSQNPDFAGIFERKPRLLLLNKADLADSEATAAWVRAFADRGLKALPVDSRSGKGLREVMPAVREILRELLAAYAAKGMAGRPASMMVVGIPNVGKSSFINRFVKGARAKVEDRPGVTRGNQWFAVDGGARLLDTPGVLWPKLTGESGEHLAFTGAIKDTLLDTQAHTVRLLQVLSVRYGDALRARYKLGDAMESTGDLLDSIALSRGMLISGGEADVERAAAMVLDEFRAGKIGRCTLEWPTPGGRA